MTKLTFDHLPDPGWLAPTGVLLLICFFALALYPLTGEAREQIKAKLALVQREKEKE